MKLRMIYLAPLVGLALMVGLLGWGLTRDPSLVPSPLIDKPVPKFRLPQLRHPERQFSSDRLSKGELSLVNVWASWCSACRLEHPMLMQISGSGVVPIYGLDYKDDSREALAMLDSLGDPYRIVAQDKIGRVAIDWGVYGVPETYLVDGRGIIRYKQIGPITPVVWRDTLLPLIESLQRDGSTEPD